MKEGGGWGAAEAGVAPWGGGGGKNLSIFSFEGGLVRDTRGVSFEYRCFWGGGGRGVGNVGVEPRPFRSNGGGRGRDLIFLPPETAQRDPQTKKGQVGGGVGRGNT